MAAFWFSVDSPRAAFEDANKNIHGLSSNAQYPLKGKKKKKQFIHDLLIKLNMKNTDKYSSFK